MCGIVRYGFSYLRPKYDSQETSNKQYIERCYENKFRDQLKNKNQYCFLLMNFQIRNILIDLQNNEFLALYQCVT